MGELKIELREFKTSARAGTPSRRAPPAVGGAALPPVPKSVPDDNNGGCGSDG